MYLIKKMRADHVLDFAAEELKKYLRMMMPECGEIDIIYEPGAKDGFRLGLMEDFGLDTSEAGDLVLDDILHIDTDLDGGIIAGSNGRSVLMAVYRYLRENGCRWLYPGIDGEHIPVADIKPVQYHKMADHRFRGVCNEGAESQQAMMETIDFNAKVGMNVYMMEFDCPYSYYEKYYSHAYNQKNRPAEMITRQQVTQWKRLCEAEISKRGLQFHDMGHGWTAEPYGISSVRGWTTSDQELSEETRSYLAMIDGKREFYKGVPINTNVCMSNPKVRSIMANAIADYAEKHWNADYIHVWLADGTNNHCECPECQKMIPTDYYLMIMNELDEILTAKGLKTRIVFICYVDTMWGPEKVIIKNPERFSLLYAPIHRTYTASAGAHTKEVPVQVYKRNRWTQPQSMEENLALLKTWKEKWNGPCFSYEYHFWKNECYDPAGMYLARRIYEDIQGLKAIGVDGYVEDGSQRSFFPNGFAMYTYAWTLFDRSLSFEELKEDYFSHAYGEDWKKAADLLERMSETFDFAWFAGERSADEEKGKYYNPAHAEQLKKIAALCEEELELAKEHQFMPTRPQSISWLLLRRHAEFAEGLAAVMAEKAAGNDDKAKEMYKEYVHRFGRHECEIEQYYDHRQFMYFYERILQNGERGVPSFVNGE